MSVHAGPDLLRSLVSKWRDYRATLASLRELESNDPGLVAQSIAHGKRARHKPTPPHDFKIGSDGGSRHPRKG